MKILIDNGHGENTPGKRSPDGRFHEYLYAREIAVRMEAALRAAGFDAERIVKESVDVPLVERIHRVNEVCRSLGASKVVLVSVHCNASGRGEWMQARGWSAYTCKGKTKSDALADLLYEQADKLFVGQTIRKDFVDGDADWEEDFYILSNSKCPAVLTENFFQDNRKDVAFLESEEGKRLVVKVHVDALINYVAKYG